jgi:Mn-dependent DtxR family transcriptional regulator
VRSILSDLRSHNLLERNGEQIRLTAAGWSRAEEMVRAHRLWETYIADRANVPPEQLHTPAERLEHAHELADALDAELGHPDTDPHGEPIPRPSNDSGAT